jgi:hypothetical protein
MHYLLIFVLMSSSVITPPRQTYCKCLPEGVSETDVVTHRPAKSGNGTETKAVTVAETLVQLKARCRNGRLLDQAGRQIYFFRLTGCWGNPPEDYQEILDKQNIELTRLKKRYHVIEMTCNESGMLIS